MTEQQLAAALGGNPLIAHLLWQRGCQTLEAAQGFLDPNHYTPTPPFALPGMSEAVARLRQAIARAEHILVWGDFDVDGQTATSVLLLGLRGLGAHATYSIPDRATHSHGLNKPELARAREQGASVLLTCDCGVTDFEEVDFARRLGFDVIITDHHDMDERLPDAHAVINPKRLPQNSPLAHLPGVGVAYKLIEALGGGAEYGADLLDLVALGIVSDLAYLCGDTRYLLQRGLARLRGSARAGIRALMQASGLDAATLTADDLGFQIGPRLNAIGRLDKAEMGVRLLISQDENEARQLATRIEELNAERKIIQRKVEEDAARQIDRNPALIRQPVIILQSEDWHPSVIGIAASGLARRFNRPALLIAARAGEVGRGSARSVDGVDIHAAIAAAHRLVTSSGGHPMAAGFGIRPENIPAFRDAITQHVRKQVEDNAAGGAPSAQPKNADAVLDWSDNWMPLAMELERLAPFGPGNRRPVFLCQNLSVSRTEPVGKDSSHRAVFLKNAAGVVGRAIWWGSAAKNVPDGALDVAFTIELNAYRGRLNAQARIDALIPREEEQQQQTAPHIGAAFAIVDARGALDRLAELRGVVARHGAQNTQVFAELSAFSGDGAAGAHVANRLNLLRLPALVFWDFPPDPATLRAVLDETKPQEVVLLAALDEGADAPNAVAQRLAAMRNTAQKRGDSPSDPQVQARMAARIGQRVETVRAMLAGETEQARFWLDETRAYRKYAQTAGSSEALNA